MALFISSMSLVRAACRPVAGRCGVREVACYRVEHHTADNNTSGHGPEPVAGEA